MPAPDDGPPATPWLARMMFIVSAGLAAVAFRIAWQAPLAGAAGLTLVVSLWASRWWSRRRTQRLLRSGDVHSVLNRWKASLDRIPNPQTMGPLMEATAFAAYGWVEEAREAQLSAARGPAWEGALEHRLFVDALVLAFDGYPDDALEKATSLERLPLPPASPALVQRVRVLRGAVAALARAFAHRSDSGDRALLLTAAETSPLVHWAMRYAAAIVAIDGGDLHEATVLLADAPLWPSQSRFATFHREIVAEVVLRQRAPQEAPASSEAEGPDHRSEPPGRPGASGDASPL